MPATRPRIRRELAGSGEVRKQDPCRAARFLFVYALRREHVHGGRNGGVQLGRRDTPAWPVAAGVHLIPLKIPCGIDFPYRATAVMKRLAPNPQREIHAEPHNRGQHCRERHHNRLAPYRTTSGRIGTNHRLSNFTILDIPYGKCVIY